MAGTLFVTVATNGSNNHQSPTERKPQLFIIFILVFTVHNVRNVAWYVQKLIIQIQQNDASLVVDFNHVV